MMECLMWEETAMELEGMGWVQSKQGKEKGAAKLSQQLWVVEEPVAIGQRRELKMMEVQQKVVRIWAERERGGAGMGGWEAILGAEKRGRR